MHVIEQPLPPAPEAGAEPNIVAHGQLLYDAHTELLALKAWEYEPLNYIYKEKEAIALPVLRSKGTETRSLYLYMGNGVRAQVEAIGSFNLSQHNFDSTYPNMALSTYHKTRKRIKQLQQDGLLKSTDDESFDKCESCLSGKMTKKPFPHSNERAKDLLGIIHTDVCGPLRHVSRQGASYFITFTDDYSRYGYVYLLKHKHEVFETFKVFKNKVENQLGRTKALISQEISRRAVDLEEIQEEEDTTPSEITSNIPQDGGFEPPQEEVIPIRRNTIHEVTYGNGSRSISPVVTEGSRWLLKEKTDMMVLYTSKSSSCSKGLYSTLGVGFMKETFLPGP
ncbi:retrotransposon protein, putative, ty1-copia subclass [Tanacetum coccineum]|uniref:Retrotransposon protein, putative, ty1-copia subclass n=1 Tax=Tanacetum coccineum TaxID=301880 RepID=A0ABQ5EEB9_9ASTR